MKLKVFSFFALLFAVGGFFVFQKWQDNQKLDAWRGFLAEHPAGTAVILSDQPHDWKLGNDYGLPVTPYDEVSYFFSEEIEGQYHGFSHGTKATYWYADADGKDLGSLDFEAGTGPKAVFVTLLKDFALNYQPCKYAFSTKVETTLIGDLVVDKVWSDDMPVRYCDQ